MPDNVKVTITERNGTELQFREEMPFTPSNMPFTATGFTADNVQDAIEEISDIAAPLIVPIILIQNGTLSDNEFIGYSNLIPGDATPIIAPITGTFVGFTFSNENSSADFALEFRLGTTTSSIFFTWSVDNTLTADVNLVTPEAVTAGGRMFIKYKDEGSNASDAVIVLKFKS